MLFIFYPWPKKSANLLWLVHTGVEVEVDKKSPSTFCCQHGRQKVEWQQKPELDFVEVGKKSTATCGRDFKPPVDTQMRLQVRSVLGDFAVLVAIVLWTSVDFMLALDTPKLNVPTDIKPTSANRCAIRPLCHITGKN